MNCFSPLAAIRSAAAVVCATVVSLLGGCTTYVDQTLGYDMVPSDQRMTMRHITFKNGKVKYVGKDDQGNRVDDAKEEGVFFETSLYRTDSLLSANVSYGYMGVERDNTFGLRSAEFASAIMFMNTLEEDGFGYRPIFDTLSLMIDVQHYGQDSLVSVEYYMYELKEPLLGEGKLDEDTVAYTNFDLDRFKSFEGKDNPPLFEFTFPDSINKVYPSSSFVNLKPIKGADGKMSAATWDFIRRLMLMPENTDDPEWDGYTRDKDSLYAWEEAWLERFHGVYITPKNPAEAKIGRQGSLFAINLATSGLLLEGRNRNPKDPTLIKDTVGMSYYFWDSNAELGKLSVNRIKHDYKSGLEQGVPAELDKYKMDETLSREERAASMAGVNTVWIEGVAGPVLELHFTDEFIDAIKGVAEGGKFGEDADEKYRMVAVNQCLMHLYMEGASYDWETTQNNAEYLYPQLDASIGRLGAYTSFKKLVNIVDYDYYLESSASTKLDYDGELNRSRACYMMNITGYMQQLYNYVKDKTKGEDGKYHFDEADENYVSPTIYIGPEAVDPYTFDRVTLQGVGNEAPIHLELTYTLFNK